MKKIIGTIGIALTALALSSCNGLLDIPQHGVLNTETYYSTDEEIDNASADLYINMRAIEASAITLKPLLEGDWWAGGGQHGDNSALDRLAEYTFDAEDGTITSYFKSLYSLLFSANTAISRIDPSKSETAKRTVAEAKLFRSFANFELVTLWGTPPFVDHPLEPSEYKQGNGDPADFWAQIEKDLTEAIESDALAQKSSKTDKDVWRVSKQYAQALLGKAYLWQGKNAEAAAEFDKVIDSELYDLFDGDYADKNTVANKFNCENIFESIFPNDPANPVVSFTGYMLGWRTDRMTGYQAYGIEMGFGFVAPKKALYDAFKAHDGMSKRFVGTMKDLDQMKAIGIDMIEGAIQMGEGIYMWKTRYTSDFTPQMWCTSKDYVWMRFNEVLLLAAEANLTVNNEKALRYINRVRTHAGIAELGSVTLDDIKAEKRFECCLEGVAYQDLQRWGDTYERTKDVGKTEPIFHSDGSITYFDCGNPDDKCGFKKGKHERLPFPANETRLNKNLIQNNGF